ncbi:N-acetyl-alpha-D-glucosaminyl L-malate synthase BshA [Lutimonas zeaxanthinifaciens]|uniref:N-acetyl-alpha-D-glucosaminyl L-malate synthase BshA n=1 Tax=Lutimonas zeaxanthinifaciens TaxID=3060215 RepID=UPI00265CBF5E|nr:N-acetyl-alpha-D-glucosaminyl L-malate synthase BshA [Lutimonas sp. YSD2104]WKK64736.1 N-acetyl-alpha-D-glucosaminyl L-malate synthase BshA [Lutimonas sp. YSD2104]
MNIGIVCYPTYGGSGVVATELGMALAQKGHQVHFVTSHQPVKLNFLNHNLHFHEVFVENYPLFHYQPYNLALSSKLVESVEKYNLDVLHVHYAIPHAYAAYMAKQMLKDVGIDIPIVTTLHGTDITLVGSHPVYKPAVEFSINHSDAVTTVSQSLKEDTLRLFNIRKNIEVIYNFIDFEQQENWNSEDCIRGTLAKPDEKILAHVSNLRPVKRVLDVIRIFHKVQEQISAKLILVGDGPDREKADLLAKELGINEKILFLGKSDEIRKILCLSDLFLLPSETESFGLAALEAMAGKTPVISSNTGGLPEVNIDGVTGFLSDVGNVDEMAKNAIYLLSNEKRLEKFKQQAFNEAHRFSIDSILPKYEKMYMRVIKNGH